MAGLASLAMKYCKNQQLVEKNSFLDPEEKITNWTASDNLPRRNRNKMRKLGENREEQVVVQRTNCLPGHKKNRIDYLLYPY
jgi:hypothetical protein